MLKPKAKAWVFQERFEMVTRDGQRFACLVEQNKEKMLRLAGRAAKNKGKNAIVEPLRMTVKELR